MNFNVKEALSELDRITEERTAETANAKVKSRIAGLPELERSVFLLRAQKRSYTEIAHLLKRTLFDVKCAMWDAVARLSSPAGDQ
ncbi:MAG: hypothetical protein HZC28_18215 [Spirochaetes bacterium]|nr:hypothetical protein [Spirochaetota bacterium]